MSCRIKYIAVLALVFSAAGCDAAPADIQFTAAPNQGNDSTPPLVGSSTQGVREKEASEWVEDFCAGAIEVAMLRSPLPDEPSESVDSPEGKGEFLAWLSQVASFEETSGGLYATPLEKRFVFMAPFFARQARLGAWNASWLRALRDRLAGLDGEEAEVFIRRYYDHMSEAYDRDASMALVSSPYPMPATDGIWTSVESDGKDPQAVFDAERSEIDAYAESIPGCDEAWSNIGPSSPFDR